MSERSQLEIVGRSSSHYTRVTRMLAHMVGLPYRLRVVQDLTSLDAANFGDNPSLTIPTLRNGEELLFGTENICRRIVELAGSDTRIVWPEEVQSMLARNAQELTWSAMSHQVQLIIGRAGGRGDADLVIAKREAGLRGALAWLEKHLSDALDALPRPREASLLELTLFCLIEHLQFRPTVSLEPHPKLRAFAEAFSAKEAARETTYRFDGPPPAPRTALLP